jgi:transposase
MVTQFEKKFDATSFHHFLRKLMRHRCQGRRLVVILDNARYHHAQLLAPFL